MRLLGWSFGEAVLTGAFVGAGAGLLIPDHDFGTGLGAWCLALALRMILKAR